MTPATREVTPLEPGDADRLRLLLRVRAIRIDRMTIEVRRCREAVARCEAAATKARAAVSAARAALTALLRWMQEHPHEIARWIRVIDERRAGLSAALSEAQASEAKMNEALQLAQAAATAAATALMRARHRQGALQERRTQGVRAFDAKRETALADEHVPPATGTALSHVIAFPARGAQPARLTPKGSFT